MRFVCTLFVSNSRSRSYNYRKYMCSNSCECHIRLLLKVLNQKVKNININVNIIHIYVDKQVTTDLDGRIRTNAGVFDVCDGLELRRTNACTYACACTQHMHIQCAACTCVLNLHEKSQHSFRLNNGYYNNT
jgi:hypothetical protein